MRHQNVIIILTKHLPQNILEINVNLFVLKFAWKHIYTDPAA